MRSILGCENRGSRWELLGVPKRRRLEPRFYYLVVGGVWGRSKSDAASERSGLETLFALLKDGRMA